MEIRRYHKKEIAARQLETALQLYFSGENLFSVVTLAGAAEEILAGLLRRGRGDRGGILRRALDVLRPARRVVPEARVPPHEDDLYIHTDLRREALFLLKRAIEDHLAAGGTLSAAMARFNNESGGGT